MKTPTYLRSERHFTTQGEGDGSLIAALAKETTEDLQAAYLDYLCSPHCSHPVFGGNARRWKSELGAELVRRGMHQFFKRDFFGTLAITAHA